MLVNRKYQAVEIAVVGLILGLVFVINTIAPASPSHMTYAQFLEQMGLSMRTAKDALKDNHVVATLNGKPIPYSYFVLKSIHMTEAAKARNQKIPDNSAVLQAVLKDQAYIQLAEDLNLIPSEKDLTEYLEWQLQGVEKADNKNELATFFQTAAINPREYFFEYARPFYLLDLVNKNLMSYYQDHNPRLENEPEKDYYERIAKLIEETVDKKLQESKVEVKDTVR